ncbi:MAG: EVE domain-containing protein [Methylocystis sp.]
MAHWLFKSEPSTWSWEQQVAAGAKGTFWNGVRNHLAKKHLMAMKKGESGFFYHSNDDRAIVGIVEVIKTYYPDDSDETSKFGMVDVKEIKPIKRPISLVEIKGQKALADMVLVNNSRLSVQPVLEAEWRLILTLAGMKP